MNDAEFKRHLKDLAHGHHHPEEHDWAEPQVGQARKPATKSAAAKPRARKSTKRK